MLIRFLLIALAAAGAVPAASAVSTATSTVSLDAVLATARRHNPSIEAARRQWTAAQAAASRADGFPDPTLSLMVMTDHLQTRGGPMENRYTVSQALPFYGKRNLKERVADFDAAIAEEAYKAKTLEVLTKTAEAYAGLFFVDRAIDVERNLADRLRALASVAERRYVAGDESFARVALAKAELATLRVRLETRRASRGAALSTLNALLNRPSDTPLEPAASDFRSFLTPSTAAVGALQRLALRERPDIRALESMAAQSEAARRLAVREYFPDLMVGYEITEIGAGTTNTDFDGEDARAWMLRFNLPLWRNEIRAGVRAAEARTAAADARLIEARNEARAEVESRWVDFDDAQRRARVFDETVLPLAEQAFRSTLRAYESERLAFSDLMDAFESLMTARLDRARARADTLASRARLDRAVGGRLAAIPNAVEESDEP